jgi:2-dehydro-3-deoxygluconokinase
MSTIPADRIVTFGEVMVRLAPPGYQRFAQAVPGDLEVSLAGAEVNVAASLARLGRRTAFVTALPRHALAEAVVAQLRGLGVDTRDIVRTPQGRLGLFFFEKGINQRPAEVIYDREGSTVSQLPPDQYDWAAIFEGAAWFHLSGITPAISRNAAAVAEEAVRQASARGLTISFDMNFRSKLWQWEPGTAPRELAARTVRGLMPWVHVFIGGPDDVVLLTDLPLEISEGGRHAPAARNLAARYPGLTHVAMTVREALSSSHHRLGGLLHNVGSGQTFYAPQQQGHLKPYDIPHVVDRLGGGDAFAAGLIFSLTTPEGTDPQAALDFAVAASCLAHSTEGDFNCATAEEVLFLTQGSQAGQVNR